VGPSVKEIPLLKERIGLELWPATTSADFWNFAGPWTSPQSKNIVDATNLTLTQLSSDTPLGLGRRKKTW